MKQPKMILLFMLFFCCSIFYVQQTKAASEPVVRANEVERGIWQVDTPRPTAKQLMKLYAIEVIGSTKRVIVDDASVNYHQTGTYTIRFLIDGQVLATVPMIIQEQTPLPVPYDLLFERDLDEKESLKTFMMTALFGEKMADYTLEWLAQPPVLNEVGTYIVPLRLIDSYGRQVQKTATIRVLNRKKPQFTIDRKHVYYHQGERMTQDQVIKDANITVQERSTVTEVQIDLSQVNRFKEGRYTAMVTAKDTAGNEATPQEMFIHIGRKEMNELQYELGEPISIQKLKRDLAPLSIQGMDLTQVDFKKIGHYELPVYLNNRQTKQIPLTILDTTPPTISIQKKKYVYEQGDDITVEKILKDLQATIRDYDRKDLTLELSKPIEEIRRSGKHKIQLIGRDRSGNETFIPVQVDVLEHAWISSGQRGDSKNTNKLFKTKTITAEANQVGQETEILKANHHTTTVKTSDSPILPIKKWLPIGVFLLLIGMLVFLRTKRVFRKNTFFHRRSLK